MKRMLTALLLLLTIDAYCQNDRNGNPVFNSITTAEEKVGDCSLIINYYTLKNNIENKQTSVYISDEPTLKQVAKAATGLPSDNFILLRNGAVVKMILLSGMPKAKLRVLDPTSNKMTEFKFSPKGDITQNRAEEIIREKYDSNAVIKDGQLFFNNEKYDIIYNDAIKTAVLELVNKENYVAAPSSKMTIRSQQELKTLILAETKKGGKMDVFTPIEGKEMEAVRTKTGAITTNIGMALYYWGFATNELGVNTVEDALAIFAEFKGRKLDEREISYIKLGFEKGLEK